MSADSDRTSRAIAHFVVPGGIIAFCALAYWLSTQFERVPPILKRGIQPSDFPQLVIGLIVFLAIVLMVTDRSDPPSPLSGTVWKTMALLIGFMLVAEIDIFIGLALFAGTLTLLWGERRPIMIVLVAVIVPALVFLLFDGVFEIRFPRGLLTNLWYG
ncbi:tripartite tricarboxylate transporter TctB family protein [Tropicimonas sp. TH_r6]|uniref:tripartite tricarboxylate transporter TctB family protein n=1 Tax=Tropicimonas sp. TH_r6 TaxID=3082085 RepID=UPI0029550992|nr:tripartite tricarboxylate transporter TctB family protein [Tropicimonas sp. TH_r6]MDV7144285.1 tripartite tricarboxylate transporter TctB family protein [Tropicimonas sp. TH_r6]